MLIFPTSVASLVYNSHQARGLDNILNGFTHTATVPMKSEDGALNVYPRTITSSRITLKPDNFFLKSRMPIYPFLLLTRCPPRFYIIPQTNRLSGY